MLVTNKDHSRIVSVGKERVNSLPKDEISDLSISKEFVNDKLKVAHEIFL